MYSLQYSKRCSLVRTVNLGSIWSWNGTVQRTQLDLPVPGTSYCAVLYFLPTFQSVYIL